MSRQNLAVAALFLLSLLVWRWFDDSLRLPEEQPEEIFQPTFTAKNLTSVRYNQAGRITDEVFAEHTEYYETLDMAELTRPVVITHDESGKPTWRLSARTGVINQDDNAIMRDEVQIKNLAPEARIDRLTTAYLELDLTNHQIRSNQKLDIDGPGFHIEGIGLRGQLDQNSYELLDKSHATYFNRD